MDTVLVEVSSYLRTISLMILPAVMVWIIYRGHKQRYRLYTYHISYRAMLYENVNGGVVKIPHQFVTHVVVTSKHLLASAYYLNRAMNAVKKSDRTILENMAKTGMEIREENESVILSVNLLGANPVSAREYRQAPDYNIPWTPRTWLLESGTLRAGIHTSEKKSGTGSERTDI